MFNNLLDLTRLESSLSVIARMNFRIDELLMNLVSELSRIQPECKVKFEIPSTPDEEFQFEIYGNEGLIKTAFQNLVENACKFSNNQPVAIRLEIVDEKVRVSVEDRGPGISDKEVEKIFQPFYRGDTTITTPGHGLGLSLAKLIIEQHGGSIRILNNKKEGITVETILPHR